MFRCIANATTHIRPYRQMSTAPYIFRASEHRPEPRTHPLDSSIHREQVSLGDPTGLTQLGVHLCRLPPHNTSTLVHWHSMEDEWFYILKASDDARLLIREVDHDNVIREEVIKTGDFLGFPAGVKNGRALKSGESELMYLAGGSRKQLEIVHYPEKEKRLVIDRTGAVPSWVVEEKDVKESQITAKSKK